MDKKTKELLDKAYTEHAKDITQEDLDMINQLANEVFQRIEEQEEFSPIHRQS